MFFGKLVLRTDPKSATSTRNELAERPFVFATRSSTYLKKAGDVFKIHNPGLAPNAGADSISFESVRWPGYYLKHRAEENDFKFRIAKAQPHNFRIFNKEATFVVEKYHGVEGSGMLRLFEKPDWYMCVRKYGYQNSALKAMKNDFSNNFQKRCSFFIEKLEPEMVVPELSKATTTRNELGIPVASKRKHVQRPMVEIRRMLDDYVERGKNALEKDQNSQGTNDKPGNEMAEDFTNTQREQTSPRNTWWNEAANYNGEVGRTLPSNVDMQGMQPLNYNNIADSFTKYNIKVTGAKPPGDFNVQNKDGVATFIPQEGNGQLPPEEGQGTARLDSYEFSRIPPVHIYPQPMDGNPFSSRYSRTRTERRSSHENTFFTGMRRDTVPGSSQEKPNNNNSTFPALNISRPMKTSFDEVHLTKNEQQPTRLDFINRADDGLKISIDDPSYPSTIDEKIPFNTLQFFAGDPENSNYLHSNQLNDQYVQNLLETASQKHSVPTYLSSIQKSEMSKMVKPPFIAKLESKGLHVKPKSPVVYNTMDGRGKMAKNIPFLFDQAPRGETKMQVKHVYADSHGHIEGFSPNSLVGKLTSPGHSLAELKKLGKQVRLGQNCRRSEMSAIDVAECDDGGGGGRMSNDTGHQDEETSEGEDEGLAHHGSNSYAGRDDEELGSEHGHSTEDPVDSITTENADGDKETETEEIYGRNKEHHDGEEGDSEDDEKPEEDDGDVDDPEENADRATHHDAEDEKNEADQKMYHDEEHEESDEKGDVHYYTHEAWLLHKAEEKMKKQQGGGSSTNSSSTTNSTSDASNSTSTDGQSSSDQSSSDQSSSSNSTTPSESQNSSNNSSSSDNSTSSASENSNSNDSSQDTSNDSNNNSNSTESNSSSSNSTESSSTNNSNSSSNSSSSEDNSGSNSTQKALADEKTDNSSKTDRQVQLLKQINMEDKSKNQTKDNEMQKISKVNLKSGNSINNFDGNLMVENMTDSKSPVTLNVSATHIVRFIDEKLSNMSKSPKQISKVKFGSENVEANGTVDKLKQEKILTILRTKLKARPDEIENLLNTTLSFTEDNKNRTASVTSSPAQNDTEEQQPNKEKKVESSQNVKKPESVEKVEKPESNAQKSAVGENIEKVSNESASQESASVKTEDGDQPHKEVNELSEGDKSAKHETGEKKGNGVEGEEKKKDDEDDPVKAEISSMLEHSGATHKEVDKNGEMHYYTDDAWKMKKEEEKKNKAKEKKENAKNKAKSKSDTSSLPPDSKEPTLNFLNVSGPVIKKVISDLLLRKPALMNKTGLLTDRLMAGLSKQPLLGNASKMQQEHVIKHIKNSTNTLLSLPDLEKLRVPINDLAESPDKLESAKAKSILANLKKVDKQNITSEEDVIQGIVNDLTKKHSYSMTDRPGDKFEVHSEMSSLGFGQDNGKYMGKTLDLSKTAKWVRDKDGNSTKSKNTRKKKKAEKDLLFDSTGFGLRKNFTRKPRKNLTITQTKLPQETRNGSKVDRLKALNLNEKIALMSDKHPLHLVSKFAGASSDDNTRFTERRKTEHDLNNDSAPNKKKPDQILASITSFEKRINAAVDNKSRVDSMHQLKDEEHGAESGDVDEAYDINLMLMDNGSGESDIKWHSQPPPLLPTPASARPETIDDIKIYKVKKKEPHLEGLKPKGKNTKNVNRAKPTVSMKMAKPTWPDYSTFDRNATNENKPQSVKHDVHKKKHLDETDNSTSEDTSNYVTDKLIRQLERSTEMLKAHMKAVNDTKIDVTNASKIVKFDANNRTQDAVDFGESDTLEKLANFEDIDTFSGFGENESKFTNGGDFSSDDTKALNDYLESGKAGVKQIDPGLKEMSVKNTTKPSNETAKRGGEKRPVRKDQSGKQRCDMCVPATDDEDLNSISKVMSEMMEKDGRLGMKTLDSIDKSARKILSENDVKSTLTDEKPTFTDMRLTPTDEKPTFTDMKLTPTDEKPTFTDEKDGPKYVSENMQDYSQQVPFSNTKNLKHKARLEVKVPISYTKPVVAQQLRKVQPIAMATPSSIKLQGSKEDIIHEFRQLLKLADQKPVAGHGDLKKVSPMIRGSMKEVVNLAHKIESNNVGKGKSGEEGDEHEKEVATLKLLHGKVDLENVDGESSNQHKIVTVKDESEKERMVNGLVNDADRCVSLQFDNALGNRYKLVSSINNHGYTPRGKVFTLKQVFKDPKAHRYVSFHVKDEADPDRVVLLNGARELVAVPVSCHYRPRVIRVTSRQPAKLINLFKKNGVSRKKLQMKLFDGDNEVATCPSSCTEYCATSCPNYCCSAPIQDGIQHFVTARSKTSSIPFNEEMNVLSAGQRLNDDDVDTTNRRAFEEDADQMDSWWW